MPSLVIHHHTVCGGEVLDLRSPEPTLASPPVAEHQQRRITTEPVLLDKQRSEEHTSELQSLMRTSYAVFCLKKKNTPNSLTMYPIILHTSGIYTDTRITIIVKTNP